MRKVILIHLFNDRSGSPKVLYQVAMALQKKGVDFEIVTSSHSGFLSDISCSRVRVFYKRTENKIVTLLFYLVSQIHLFFICLRYLNEDVVFYVNTMMPCGAGLAGYVMRKPVIYHIHETSLRPRVLKFFLRQIIRLVAKKVIFVSEYLRSVEAFQGKEQYVVHNALDSFPCVGVRAPASDFSILMICSLKAYKGVFEFLELARGCLKYSHLNFRLVLNASDAEIDNLISRETVPGNVSIYPRQRDVSKFYESSDLLLNLSRPDECVETFGLTIIEGMSYGLPVIVPPLGGPAEIVRDNVEGYLISCYEIRRLTDLILRISEDFALYNRLSCNARARAEDFKVADFERKIFDILFS